MMDYRQVSAVLMIIDRQWLLCTVVLITAIVQGTDALHKMMFVVFIDRQLNHESVAVLRRRTHFYSVILLFSAAFFCASL